MHVLPLPGLPMVQPGDDLTRLLLDAIRDAGIELTKTFTQDALPPAAAPAPFKAGWSYGSVGPELK